MKKYNFNAGPSILPREVIEQTAQACLDFDNSGLSLMEISHRAKNFQPVVDEAVALFKEILDIPEGYSVLFLGGGASLEFCMVPYNYLEKKAAYLNTGVWATKAEKEAKLFGEVVEVASSKDKNFTYIPKDFEIPADADYFHITTNNTIYGTEIRKDIDSPVPLIADMSSDIFSRPLDVSKYTCIYGGAQKNLAMAGLTFVIIKDDSLGKVSRQIPTMLDYQGLYVQHPSCSAYLLRTHEPQIHQGTWRRTGYGEARPAARRDSLRRDRPQQTFHWYSRGRQPLAHEPHVRLEG